MLEKLQKDLAMAASSVTQTFNKKRLKRLEKKEEAKKKFRFENLGEKN